jgi:hypothetical protein
MSGLPKKYPDAAAELHQIFAARDLHARGLRLRRLRRGEEQDDECSAGEQRRERSGSGADHDFPQ